MGVVIAVVVVVVLLALLGFGLAVRIVQQYEQGVLFRLGRLRGARAPGLNLIIPGVDVLRRVYPRRPLGWPCARGTGPGSGRWRGCDLPVTPPLAIV